MASTKVRRFAALTLFAVLVALPFGAVTAQEERTSISVELQEFEDSGISGTAILTATADGGTQVAMELQGAELDGDHPTHIHTGTCDDFDPDPLYPLETVELSAVNQEGISETTVEDVTLESLREGDYVILVHQSLEELTNYLVCGEISGGTEIEAAEAEQEPDEDQENEPHQAGATEDDHDATEGHSLPADDEERSGTENGAKASTLPVSGSGPTGAFEGQSGAQVAVVLGVVATLAMLGAVALRQRRT